MASFDTKVTVTKIRGCWPGPLESTLHGDVSLGEAIALVLRQRVKDRWRFAAVKGEEQLKFSNLKQMALSDEYKEWRAAKSQYNP